MPRFPTGRPVAAVLAATLTLALTGCGDDDPDVEIVRGVPEAGFPLRGDLANDSDAIAGAADEWVEEDDERDRDLLDDDRDLRITALWAGRVNDEEFVVLANERHAALIGRRDEREPRWSLRTTVTIRDDDDPGVVAFPNAILLPEKTRSSTLLAEVTTIGIVATDGLSHASGKYASELPRGVLYLPDGLPRARDRMTDRPPVMLRTGEGGQSALRTVGTGLRSRLQPGGAAFDQPALQRFLAATVVPEGATIRVERFGDPPVVDLVQDARIPGVGPTMIVRTAQSSITTSVRPTIGVGIGGSTVANGTEATPLPLGGSDVGDALRATSGPALGVGRIVRATREQEQTGDGPAPLLLVAGDDDVSTIEVLAETRRWSGKGPVLTVPMTWNRKRTRDTDVAVLGRDAGGRLVVPAATGGSLAAARLNAP